MTTKQRSPNYPSIALDGAVESAKALYRREGRSAVPPEVAVKAWGYSALSGNARSRLAGVRQYGVIENDAMGRVRLSQRGLTLAVAEPSSPEYQQAQREAALAPDIFRELYEGWREASDEALRHHLIVGRKFSEDGARRLIDVFRSTLTVANLDNRSYDAGMENSFEPDIDFGGSGNAGQSFGALVGVGAGVPPVQPPAPPHDSYRWPLYDDVVAEVTFTGGPLTPDDVELLGDYLKTVLKSRQRSARKALEAAETPPAIPEHIEPGDE